MINNTVNILFIRGFFVMGRVVTVCSLVLFFILGVAFSPSIAGANVQSVEVCWLKPTRYIETISISGVAEEKEKNDFTITVPLMAKEVCVKVGDEIKVGDTIATIDKEGTLAAVKGSAASLTGIVPGLPAGIGDMIAGLTGSGDGGFSLDAIPEKLVSTLSGTVSAVGLTSGVLLSSGAPIITVSSSNVLVVKMALPEGNIGRVNLGQTVAVSCAAFNGAEFYATVTHISNTARKQMVGVVNETVFDVTALIEGENSSLRPGMSVSAAIQVSEPTIINTIPYEAIQQDDSGEEFVFVLEGGVARKRIIETGIETPDGQAVLSGISTTDAVIKDAAAVSDGRRYKFTEEENK
jgi:Membrane-fusion protein